MIAFIRRHSFKLSLGAVLLLLMLLSSIYRSNPDKLQPLNQLVHAVAAPFQNTAYIAQKQLSGWFEQYLILMDIKEENTRLQQQLIQMQAELNRYIDDATRFRLLKKQLRLAEQKVPQKVFAEVIGYSVDGFHRVAIINKGQRVGIRRNYPVVVVEGLVGRVLSASTNRSVIQLLNDPRHRFPVSIQISPPLNEAIEPLNSSVIGNPQERALASGRQNKIRAERISTLASVKSGDRVITSGLAGIFPRGLAVGIVGEVSKPKHDVFQYADIIPHVDFDSLEGVFIIIQPPKNDLFQP